MANLTDKDFLAVLDRKIKDLTGEQEQLRPTIERYERIAAQIDLLKRSRNAFIVGNGNVSIQPDTGRLSFRGELGRTLLTILKEDGRPLHVNELVRRMAEQGISATGQAIAGTLGRALQLKEVQRLADHTYQIKQQE